MTHEPLIAKLHTLNFDMNALIEGVNLTLPPHIFSI